MIVFDFAERRTHEQRHEALVALVDELHNLVQLRLTPATVAQMRVLHERIGELLADLSVCSVVGN